MELLTIKDKNYNVASMKDIFEILDSNDMNEVSRYIRCYMTELFDNFYEIGDKLRHANKNGYVKTTLDIANIFENLSSTLDEVTT